MRGALNPETRHARVGAKGMDLLVQSHQRENAVDARLDRQVRVLKWIVVFLRPTSASRKKQRKRGETSEHRIPASHKLSFTAAGSKQSIGQCWKNTEEK